MSAINVYTIKNGLFSLPLQVQSQEPGQGGETYTVKLVDRNGMPSCGCHSWLWTHLPCKHMFALMHNIPSVSWEAMPEQYRSSPFFNLDLDLLGTMGSLSLSAPEDSEAFMQIPPRELEDTAEEGPEVEYRYMHLNSSRHKPSGLKAAALQCRERLKIIQDATYLCQDVASLQHLSGMLDVCTTFIQGHLDWDAGLAKEIVPKAKKLSKKPKQLVPAHQQTDIGLLQCTSRKARGGLQKRVGTRAEAARQSRFLTSISSSEEVVVIIEGHADIPENSGKINT